MKALQSRAISMCVFHRSMIAACILAAAPAAAQDADRGSALVGISAVFGELHHIRRVCDARGESDIWRERMKNLIDLEQPSFELREEMVRAFNDGYVGAQRRFPYCDRDAEDYAAARAAFGEVLLSALTAPLHEAMRADEEGVNVWRGGDRQ